MNQETASSRASFRARRVLFFGSVLLLTVLATFLFADWLQRTGLTPAKWMLIGLYAILTLGLSFGFCQALFGWIILMLRRDPARITRHIELSEASTQTPIQSKVALLFPVYNEEPKRFFNGIRTTYRELEKAGQLEHFSFFVLSDSNKPNHWIEEETQWLELIDELQARGRLHYRHRASNLNQKSGNVSDFCRRWGSHFDHMICFDADSLMSADCITKLVRLIEANPKVGIIQTMPGLFGGKTLFARLQQFANRIHGELSGAGLNFWQLSEGNYWGHNAIIRLAPFIESCTLPELPGPKPLGGRVLSHDFVEAALMRKAGYEVWLAYDITDTFEEVPPTLIDFAQRDRRWCQGNLQHGWIALFGKIPFLNRVHMLNGIYAYLAAPLWLTFLGVSTLAAYSWQSSGLTLMIRPGKFFISPRDIQAHGLVVLGITLALIFLPKLFTVIRLLFEVSFRKRFGGAIKATASIGLEVLAFSLLAPALMLFHSAFVLATLTGKKVTWSTQNREGVTHTGWMNALRAHAGHSLVGLLWAILAWQIDPTLFYWMSPVLLGWVAAAPLSVFTSHTDAAKWLSRQGYLKTPEELNPSAVIQTLRALEEIETHEPMPIVELRDDFGLIQVVLDPYINALHLDFLPKRKNQNVETKEALNALAEKLATKGAPALSNLEKNRILNDPETVGRLHRRIWSLSEDQLHSWWQLAMSRYSRRSLFVAEMD